MERAQARSWYIGSIGSFTGSHHGRSRRGHETCGESTEFGGHGNHGNHGNHGALPMNLRKASWYLP